MYRKFFKRFLDILFSLFGLLLLLPLFLILILVGTIAMRGNPFFLQRRPGRCGRIFTLIKFRNMSGARDAEGKLLPDGCRLNAYGRFLRKTSLDELGELINVLKGDMSLVGPRPLLIRDFVFMDERTRGRHAVRGGITGLAQINGRNNITWEQKFEWDLQYVEHITFMTDVKILFRTVGKVLRGSDVVREGTDSDLDYGDYLLQRGSVTRQEYDMKQAQAKVIAETTA